MFFSLSRSLFLFLTIFFLLKILSKIGRWWTCFLKNFFHYNNKFLFCKFRTAKSCAVLCYCITFHKRKLKQHFGRKISRQNWNKNLVGGKRRKKKKSDNKNKSIWRTLSRVFFYRFELRSEDKRTEIKKIWNFLFNLISFNVNVVDVVFLLFLLFCWFFHLNLHTAQLSQLSKKRQSLSAASIVRFQSI